MLKRMASMLMCVPLITPCITYKIPHKHFNITIAKREVQCDFDEPTNRLSELEKQIEHGKEVMQNEMLNEMAISLKQLQDKQRAEEIKKQKQKQSHKRTFIVSYYGATYSECGNNHFITASGVKVQEGHIAVPRNIPFGSKIILNGTEYIATDTGNPNYIYESSDGILRVDVFVARKYGESDYQYEKRINNMGVAKIEGELYIKNK